MIRKAVLADAKKMREFYDKVTGLKKNQSFCGWEKGVYPTEKTALFAIEKGELFLKILDGEIAGSVILNKSQTEEYREISWKTLAKPQEVLVVHTLCVSPDFLGKGIARELLSFAESYGRELLCKVIRLDTFEKNLPAFSLYKSQGYDFMGKVYFKNEGRQFLCLEKKII